MTATGELRFSEVIAALSHALDITEGQPEGHAVRTCLIGMRIAEEIQLPPMERAALYYALLLKDLGCSSNAARICAIFGADDHALKRSHKVTDWTRGLPSLRYALDHAVPGSSPIARAFRVVAIGLTERGSGREMTATRCERGAVIAQMLGLSDLTADAIRTLDEHWNGRGMPLGLAGDAIPLLGRIVGIAQSMDVFFTAFGVDGAYGVAIERRGTWFDPALVDALRGFRRDHGFWERLAGADTREQVAKAEPEELVLIADEERIDDVARGFARVIDAKSPYTFRHSEGVATLAVGIAETLGFAPSAVRELERAALLHDIGKLGVSNLVLDKPGKLTEDEIRQVRRHPAYSEQILGRVARFQGLAELAGSHHERLDGRGYHRGVAGDLLSPSARVLVVADIAEALSAERPYRPALPWERVVDIMGKDVDTGICGDCFEALKTFLVDTDHAPFGPSHAVPACAAT